MDNKRLMLKRYVRAFFLALKLTIRGEPPPKPAYYARYPLLGVWLDEARRRLDVVYAAADQQGVTAIARRGMVLHIDKRDMTVDTLLASLKYHFDTEYPLLMRDTSPHNLTALYAYNLNDRYYAAQMAAVASLAGTPMQAALAALSAHLDAIPPSNQLE